ncbi:MAG: hypothetical protein GEU86_20270 [Actinophytocola sp.]|nr:hypothetical protein [Actinophytocola sp.]
MSSNTKSETETVDPKPEAEPAGEQTTASQPAASTDTGDTVTDTPAATDTADPAAVPETGSGGTAVVPAVTAPRGGFLAGAAAVLSAGIGVSSLTGTSLSEMLRSRQEVIGQIEAGAGGGGGDQVQALYGTPWHTTAVVNGIFALIAVLIGGALLAVHAKRADTRPWVTAVALGGVVLGALGLLVAGGMYFDLFGAQPELPAMPQQPVPGG